MVNEAGWGSIYFLSFTEYIGLFTGDDYIAKSPDRHVKQESGLVPAEQWHGRLFNFPSGRYNGYEVICAAHRDPADHGIFPGDEKWRFNDSRDKFLDVWNSKLGYTTTKRPMGNGYGFETSDGDLGIIS